MENDFYEIVDLLNYSSIKFISIDIGIEGAIALFNNENKLVNVIDIPYRKDRLDYCELFDFVVSLNKVNPNCTAYVEYPTFSELSNVSSRSKNTSYKFGINVGIMESLLELSRMPWVKVHPRSWESYHKLIGKTKKDSCILASSLFIAMSNRFIDFETAFNGKTKPIYYDGRADASLIGLYVINKLL